MSHPVVYFEIYGPDPDALSAFYGELFGWSMQDMPGMNYRMVDTNGGGGVNGGIGVNPDKSTMETLYVETPDLQGMLDKAEQLGSKTIIPVMDVPGGPTIGMFTDPVGNPIGIVAPPTGEPRGPSKGDGCAVSWFEINGGPFDAQAAFYETLFGWTFKRSENPGFIYGEIENPPSSYGTAGALSASDDGRTGIALWAEVDDPNKYLEKAEGLGATIEMQPVKPNDNLTVATFVDPAGNRFGVYRYTP